jgi:hypothetical protein
VAATLFYRPSLPLAAARTVLVALVAVVISMHQTPQVQPIKVTQAPLVLATKVVVAAEPVVLVDSKMAEAV